MNEYELFASKREIEHILLQDAKAVMQRGLEYFAGENYQWLPEYEEISEWLTDNKRKGLLLFGGNGLGKTMICTRIFPVIFKYYLKLEYFYADAIRLSEYYKNPIDNYELESNKPLIIDDFGIERVVSDYGEKRDLFSEIVDLSEKRGRLLILTTNLTPEEIGERYGLRTLDRLRTIVQAVKIDGKSLRNRQ